MKKEVKIIIAAVLALWFFVMGFEIGSYAEKKKFAQSQPQTVAPQITEPTQAPTQAPDNTPTQVPDNNPTQGTQPTVQSQPTDKSKDEIIADVAKYMNQLRSEQNVQAHKTASVYVNVVDCSVPSAMSIMNNVISGITDKLAPEENYVFAGGQGVDASGNAVTPRDVIPPKGKDFNLPATAVASARAETQGNNTVYYITLVEENTTIENPIPPYHDASLGYLDITALDLPITVTRGNMHYPSSTIEFAVDNTSGKIVTLKERVPMSGDGATTVLGKEGTASFEGALEENWTFVY